MPLTMPRPEALPATAGLHLERTAIPNLSAFFTPFYALLYYETNLIVYYKQFHLQLGNLRNYTIRFRKLFSGQLLKNEHAGGKLSQLHYVAGDDAEQQYTKTG